jgi:hypothetical protein
MKKNLSFLDLGKIMNVEEVTCLNANPYIDKRFLLGADIMGKALTGGDIIDALLASLCSTQLD